MNKSLFTLSLLCCLPAFGMQRRVTAAAMRAATARAATPVARAAQAAPAAAAVRANWAAHARLMATQQDEQPEPTLGEQTAALIADRKDRITQLDKKRRKNLLVAASIVGLGAAIGSFDLSPDDFDAEYLVLMASIILLATTVGSPDFAAEHFHQGMGACLGIGGVVYGVRSHRDAAEAKAKVQREIDTLEKLD